MKKKVLIGIAMMALTIGAKAQWFDFSNNNDRFSIGFQGGVSAIGSDYSGVGFGISLSALGVYLDFILDDADHKFDNHVNNMLYNDSVSYSINLGYQIPVLPWLRVMPLLGYSQTNYGITDASTVNVETNENSSSIYHDYTVTSGSRKHSFNYGVGLFVQPVRYFDLYAVASRHAIYGGFCLNLNAFRNE